MCPVPAIISTVVGIEHIVARILQILGCTLGFLHVTPQLLGILTGNDTLLEAFQLGFHAVAQRNRKIVAAGVLDSVNNFRSKAVAVFKAAAVLVGTLVEKFNGELIQQISFVNGMDFHAVNTRVFAELCGLGKGLDNLMDLFLGHLGADDVRCPAGRLRAGGCQLMAGVQNGLQDGSGELILVQRSNQFGNCPAAAHAGSQLDEELGTGLMDLVHEFLQLVEHLGILPQPLAPEGIPQRGNTGDDQANIILSPFLKQLCSFLVKLTAGKLKPTEEGSATHGAHDNTVLDLHIADFPGGK